MKKQVIISFILGAIIFGGVGTILAYKLGANQVGYTPNDQTWNVSEVDTALDDLYDMATYGNATSSDIASGKTALVNGIQITGTLDVSSIGGDIDNVIGIVTTAATSTNAKIKIIKHDSAVERSAGSLTSSNPWEDENVVITYSSPNYYVKLKKDCVVNGVATSAGSKVTWTYGNYAQKIIFC